MLCFLYKGRSQKCTIGKCTVDACNENDPMFREVMETQEDLKDTEGYDWLEKTDPNVPLISDSSC